MVIEEGHPDASATDREGVEDEPRGDFRARVLVVEDEHELRALIARWLETRGYQVVEAPDGRDAVELLEAGLEPDVILLDLTMPRMDGRAFLEWLRNEPKHAHRRVIVASAYLEDEAPVDADRTFAKPFRPDLLERELARLVGE
ncbi:response regulator [Anaeromyxobacter oryzae]|uniref:Response regulator n=1 Tax=Anaeromyxobacter oryzae TaxID=2918170 RepID=A0ABM7WPD7_9BACT|nr:response regulator [Anaeromyxobacter oryzae]BDG01332.1 response regulator [Anaeromyxobacter oryzae]